MLQNLYRELRNHNIRSRKNNWAPEPSTSQRLRDSILWMLISIQEGSIPSLLDGWDFLPGFNRSAARVLCNGIVRWLVLTCHHPDFKSLASPLSPEHPMSLAVLYALPQFSRSSFSLLSPVMKCHGMCCCFCNALSRLTAIPSTLDDFPCNAHLPTTVPLTPNSSPLQRESVCPGMYSSATLLITLG